MLKDIQKRFQVLDKNHSCGKIGETVKERLKDVKETEAKTGKVGGP